MKNLFLTILFTIALASANASAVDTAKKTESEKQKNGTSKTDDEAVSHQKWQGKKVECLDWLIVFSPMALFILSVIAINHKTGDFKLQDALTENQYPKITKLNPLFTNDDLNKLQATPAMITLLTPTIEVSDTAKGFPKSSSRYLALLTTALTLIIAASLASAYIFIYISSGEQPEFNHLGDVLLALGIGITPYAFNKVSTAINTKL